MIIISFFLDGLLSNYFPFPFFLTLTALIFYSSIEKEEAIVRNSLIIGVLYDITYTNTLFLNGILFFLIAIFLKNTDKKHQKNLFHLFILNIFIQFIYLFIVYFLLLLFRYLHFNVFILLKCLIEAIFIDTIYFFVLYFIHHKIRCHT